MVELRLTGLRALLKLLKQTDSHGMRSMVKISAALTFFVFSLYAFAPAASAQQAYGGYAPYYPQSAQQPINYNQAPGLVAPEVEPLNIPSNFQAAGTFTPNGGYNSISMQTQVPSQVSQGFGGGGFPQTSSQGMSAYEKQELALQESKMMQQLEDLKQRKESDQGYKLSGELDESFDEDNGSDSSGNGGAKVRGMFGKMGRMVKTSMRYAGPAAGTVGSYFLLRAAFQNSSMMIPAGSTIIVPGP